MDAGSLSERGKDGVAGDGCMGHSSRATFDGQGATISVGVVAIKGTVCYGQGAGANDRAAFGKARGFITGKGCAGNVRPGRGPEGDGAAACRVAPPEGLVS